MEWASDNNSGVVTKALLKSFQRYYIFFRVKMHKFSWKALFILNFVQTMQLLTCIFPKNESRGLPWNYTSFQPVWLTLSLVFNPPMLLDWLQVNDAVFFTCVMGMFVEQILTMGVIMFMSARVSHYDFISELGSSSISLIPNWYFRLHEICNFALLKVLYFPLVYHLAQDLTCISDYTCLQDRLPSYLLGIEAVMFVLFIGIKLTDVSFIGNVLWNNEDLESLSMCEYRTIMTWVETVLVVVTAAVSYAAHSVVHSIVLLTVGVFMLNYLYQRLPFHQFTMNRFKVVRGLMFVWSGVVCLVSEAMGTNSQGSFGATALYWFTIGFAFMILSGFFSRRLKELVVIRKPEYLYELEHMIREVLISGSESQQQMLDFMIKHSIAVFRHSPILCIWTIYYYILLKDAIFVKVTLAKLMSMPRNIMMIVESFYAVFNVENWFKDSASEQEPLDYMNLRYRYEKIQKEDLEISQRLYDTVNEIGKNTVKFETIVLNVSKLTSSIASCKYQYALTSKTYPNKELLDSYSGFLDMLQKDQKAASLRYMSAEVMKAQIKRKDSKVSLFDVKLMIVVISLSGSNFGSVLSAKGSDILGYTDEQLIGTHHSVLIPPPFNENHDRMLRNTTKFRHKHPVYESLHTLYFMERSGCIVSADWKVCLVNLPDTGALAILAAIRPHKHAIDIAFVGEGTRKITVMVSAIYRPEAFNNSCKPAIYQKKRRNPSFP